MIDVRCPQCATIFELDERQMRGGAATLQCSVCEHLFRIESSQRVPEQENHRRWMVRTRQRGDILYFTGFDTLHRWIIERRVSLQDEISRTGSRWTKLEQVGEFAPIFQVVESISMLTGGQSPPAEAPPSRAPQLNTPPPPKQQTVQQFAQPRQPLPKPQQAALPTPQAPQAPRPQPPQPQPPQQPQRAPHHATPVPPSPRQGTPASSPRQTPLAQPQLAAPAAAPDEASWSLDQLVPATQLQAERFSVDEDDVELEGPTPKRRAPLLIFLLLIGLGVGAFMAKDQLMALLAPTAPTSTPTAISETPVKPKPPAEQASAPEAAQAALMLAYDAAAGALLEAQLLKVTASEQEAQLKLALAVSKAQEEAAEEASTPDAADLIKKGDRAFSRDKYDQARGFYHQALELESRNTNAITGLGWSLFMMGKTDAAIAQFQRALHVDEGHEDAYIGLGKAERSRGRLKQALDAYEDYLRRFPSGKKASIAKYQRDQLKQALGQ